MSALPDAAFFALAQLLDGRRPAEIAELAGVLAQAIYKRSARAKKRTSDEQRAWYVAGLMRLRRRRARESVEPLLHGRLRWGARRG